MKPDAAAAMSPDDIELAGQLVAELVNMAANDPLRDTVHADCYLRQTRDRAHEIGVELDRLGGFELMVLACDAVRGYLTQLYGAEAGHLARGLEMNWHGIGQWRD